MGRRHSIFKHGFEFGRPRKHRDYPCIRLLGRELNHSLKMQWDLDTDCQPELAEDRVKRIIEKVRVTHHKSRERYNRNRKPSPYCEGDQVLYRNYIPSNKANKISHKLTQTWKGPYTIVKVLSPVNIKIQLVADPSVNKVVHVSQVKKYYSRT